MEGVGKSVVRSCNNTKQVELRRGPWTIEEDTLLIHYIACHGEGHWSNLANYAGLKRTGKSCRLRWLNYLKPDIKRGNLSPQEQLLILQLHSKWGNRWSKIARQLPGRTDNEIKNYWRTRVQKLAKQLNIESNSEQFFEIVRDSWIPRLLQKMDQKSPSINYNSPCSSLSFSQALHQNSFSIQSSETYYQWPESSESVSEEFGNNSDLQPPLIGEFKVDQQLQDTFSFFEGQMASSDWVLEDDVADNLWNLENWL